MSVVFSNGEHYEPRSFFKKKKKPNGYLPYQMVQHESILVRWSRKLAKNGISLANFIILVGLAFSAIWYYATHEFNGLYASKSDLAQLASDTKITTSFMSKDIYEIKTNQAVMAAEQNAIKKTVDKADDKLDRIAQKLFQSN